MRVRVSQSIPNRLCSEPRRDHRETRQHLLCPLAMPRTIDRPRKVFQTARHKVRSFDHRKNHWWHKSSAQLYIGESICSFLKGYTNITIIYVLNRQQFINFIDIRPASSWCVSQYYRVRVGTVGCGGPVPANIAFDDESLLQIQHHFGSVYFHPWRGFVERIGKEFHWAAVAFETRKQKIVWNSFLQPIRDNDFLLNNRLDTWVLWPYVLRKNR